MKQVNVKKLVLLNLPYFLLGLFATNGRSDPLCRADASAKCSRSSTLGGAGELVAQPAPAGFSAALLRRWRKRAGGVPVRQERQEVPPQRGV